MNNSTFVLLFATAAFVFTGCQSGSNSDPAQQQTAVSSTHNLRSNSIELMNPWIRPSAKGTNSAIYVDVYNGTNKPDTLMSVDTEIAGNAEIHETFEENGLMGMRPAGQQIIPPDSTLKLRPGGLHVMVMQVNQKLAERDSIEVEFEFAVNGTRKMVIPVKSSNSGQ